jgi:peptidyl-prolyl cis-trans isomerase D
MARRPRGSVINRRHVARLERERQQTQLIKFASITIVILIVVMVLGGVFYDRVIVSRQPVATVNGDEISTREFQARVRYERNNLVNRYYNTFQNAQAFGTDPQFVGFFQNSLNQIELQLSPDLLGREVINTLIEERILRQKAAELGITVTEAEIQERVEQFYGYYGGEQPPTATEVPTTRPTSTLTALQLTLTAPTATPVTTLTADSTPVITPTLETPANTPTPEASPTAEPTQAEDSPTPTATVPPPTPTPYTQDAFTADYQTSIRNLNRNLGFTENDLRYMVESQILREKLLEIISADVVAEQDQVWARHILVEDEATANEVLARLEAGEDFAALAAEYSTDTSNANSGGDLGWFGTGKMVAEFETAAFNTAIGQLSAPTQTTFGWHIIQVLGHELRPLSASEFEQARQAKFEEWLTQQRQLMDAEIILFDYWGDRTPDDPSVQHIDLQSLLSPATSGIVTSTPEP